MDYYSEIEVNGIEISIIVVRMGNDLNVSIYGGHKPHIGAVAISIPRQSLCDTSKTSSSTSVICVNGHKEDRLAYDIATRISATLNKVITVSCGIHIDCATYSTIGSIIQGSNKLVEEFLERYYEKS